jgi:hypothetical protein
MEFLNFHDTEKIIKNLPEEDYRNCYQKISSSGCLNLVILKQIFK